MSIMRWDPFNEVMTLRQAVDRLFEDSFVQPRMRGMDGGITGGIEMDVMEKDDAYVIKASLPGVKPDDVDITVQNNVLTVRGEMREEREAGEGRYHRRERRFGSFTRSIGLPAEVNTDGCDASFDDGVLTVKLPKAESARQRRIQIGSRSSQPAIEGQRRETAPSTGGQGNGSRRPDAEQRRGETATAGGGGSSERR